MRKPFSVPVRGTDFRWEEISFGHTFQLISFFQEVREDVAHSLTGLDGWKWCSSRTIRQNYRKKAAEMIFSLRSLPPINWLLPIATATAVPNFLRRFQSKNDMSRGLAGGFHIAVLYNLHEERVIQGLCTLERTKADPKIAELNLWKVLGVSSGDFRQAAAAMMFWSQKAAGYTDFIAHTDAPTKTQRGNIPAIKAAFALGFEDGGIRPASACNGNGKETQILRTHNWTLQACVLS